MTNTVHLTGDLYLDPSTFPRWQWYAAVLLSLAFPPTIFFFIGGSITTDANDD